MLSRGTKALQEKATKSWNNSVLNKVAPAGSKITEIGSAGFKQLKDSVNNAYSNAWKMVDEVPQKAAQDMQETIINNIDDFSVTDSRALNRVFNDIDRLSNTGTGDQLKALDNTIRKSIKSAEKGSELQNLLKDVRVTLREGLPTDAQDALKAIDSKYPAYLTVKKAAAKARKEGGEFTPSQLATSSGTVGGETAAASGEAALLKEAVAAQKTLGQSGRGELLGWVRRALNVTPTPLPLEGMGEVLLGQKGWQKAGQKALASDYADALRKYASPAKLSAAYEGSGNE